MANPTVLAIFRSLHGINNWVDMETICYTEIVKHNIDISNYDYVPVFSILATSYLMNKKYELALLLLEKLPKHTQNLIDTANAYFQLGNYHKSIEVNMEFQRTFPDSMKYNTKWEICHCYLMLDDWAGLIKYINGDITEWYIYVLCHLYLSHDGINGNSIINNIKQFITEDVKIKLHIYAEEHNKTEFFNKLLTQ